MSDVHGVCVCGEPIVPFLWWFRHVSWPRFFRGHRAWPENVLAAAKAEREERR